MNQPQPCCRLGVVTHCHLTNTNVRKISTDAVLSAQEAINAPCFVAAAAHVWSLAHSGCGFDKRVPPDLPRLGFLDESGPPTEILRKLFDADPVMQVTQEGGGTIRMMETNVPTDLLSVKIHHLPFFPSDFPFASEFDPVHGMALIAILLSPEVVSFGQGAQRSRSTT
jgi:hypothetical protein